MQKKTTGYQFGAFQGVFTPSILTILGVVMFLRFGWVLGNLGIVSTLIVVTIACSITFLTGLAIAALATNMKIGGGGAYFIISRSLGLETGAAIGLPLYLAQALGISFYIAGFSESIVGVWPELDATVVGVSLLFVLTALAFFSANLALKSQYFILVAITLSLASFFLGSTPDSAMMAREAVPANEIEPFWFVFAVFFPAVTGIEAGVSLSGDLKDPGKALTKGTLAAVLVGYVIYILIPLFLNSLDISQAELLTNPLIMADVARVGQAIYIGLWGAAISSALGAILGAPRTLQAIASDRVLPRILSKTYGNGKDPRIATAVSFFIALGGLLLGDLNVIAPILSMFFLTSYGLLNISAAFEAAISSPKWRPSLKLDWKWHLLGAFACFAAMLLINTMAAFGAIGIAVVVYLVTKRRNVRAHWGDVRYGLSMLLVRRGLLNLVDIKSGVRTWKPNLLVLCGAPQKRWYLIELANAMSRGRSLMSIAAVLPEENTSVERSRAVEKSISEYLEREDVESFTKVLRSRDPFQGMKSLVESYGFGPLEPNTVMLGDSEQRSNFHQYFELIHTICDLNKNLIIVREKEEPVSDKKPKDPPVRKAKAEPINQQSQGGSIDIWWKLGGQNSGLMLALAHQLIASNQWRKHKITLKTIDESQNEESREAARKTLSSYLERERLNVDSEIVKVESGVFETICRSSAGAAFTMIGIRAPMADESEEAYERYYTGMLGRTSSLGLVAFVYAAEDMAFSKIFDTTDNG